jgi:hypothetical protein
VSQIESRLADEVDVSLDQLSHWARLPFRRVLAWANLETDLSDEETVRLKTIISLYQGLHERLVLAGEVLDETFSTSRKNGSVG